MNAFGHISVALLAAKLLIWHISVPQLILVAFLAILPDLDHPNAFFGKLLKPFSSKVYVFFGHRTITHSLLFVFFTTNFFAFNLFFYKLAWIALGSHLFCDMLTYMGVPLFWPVQKNFVAFGGMLRTGNKKELAVSIIAAGFFVFLYL